MLAPISIRESSPNPASATDRAATAVTASTAIPATFQPSVMPSRIRPRRNSTAGCPFISGTGSPTATRPAWQRHRGQANISRQDHGPYSSAVRLAARRGLTVRTGPDGPHGRDLGT
jgi:hypothetical protein